MLHNLRAAITERFGTQLACAEASRIHPVRLNRIVNEWVQPTPDEIERLGATLDASRAWLFACVQVVPRPRQEVGADGMRVLAAS